MKKEDAHIAENLFYATSIQSKDAAAHPAPLHYVGIKEIRKSGKEPVYNMEVDNYHNFSINGGVIVHNCMDAMRYFCQTIMRREVR